MEEIDRILLSDTIVSANRFFPWKRLSPSPLVNKHAARGYAGGNTREPVKRTAKRRLTVFYPLSLEIMRSMAELLLAEIIHWRIRSSEIERDEGILAFEEAMDDTAMHYANVRPETGLFPTCVHESIQNCKHLVNYLHERLFCRQLHDKGNQCLGLVGIFWLIRLIIKDWVIEVKQIDKLFSSLSNSVFLICGWWEIVYWEIAVIISGWKFLVLIKY